MKVVFRVDSSTRIGTGHLVRCGTLASELVRRGAEVSFVCRGHPGHLQDRLDAEGHKTFLLPAPSPSAAAPHDYAAWLGVPQALDAAQTIECLDGGAVDWLVVDHYGLDKEWETRLRPHSDRLLAIDDLANRPHDCDALLDQNFHPDGARRYHDLVPPHCRLLMGPRYALLRPEYRARRRAEPRAGDVRSVFVFFGGTDAHGSSLAALEALAEIGSDELTTTVVAGPNNADRPRLEAIAALHPHVVLEASRPHLADLMAAADLAIGAGGVTTWERMCVGLPAVVVSAAENQRPGCEALARIDLIEYAGPADRIRRAELRGAIEEMVSNAPRRTAMSARAARLVDGAGTLRVAEVVAPWPSESLTLRKADSGDVIAHYDWANDPDVRRQAKNPEPIAWCDHEVWYVDRLADPLSHLYVLMAGSLAVGQIRFDRIDDEEWISYSLDAIARGRGWGRRLVSLGLKALRETGQATIRADVKVDNGASRAVFEGLGFSPVKPASPGYLSFALNQRGGNGA